MLEGELVRAMTCLGCINSTKSTCTYNFANCTFVSSARSNNKSALWTFSFYQYNLLHYEPRLPFHLSRSREEGPQNFSRGVSLKQRSKQLLHSKKQRPKRDCSILQKVRHDKWSKYLEHQVGRIILWIGGDSFVGHCRGGVHCNRRIMNFKPNASW